jgi:hypothetical protein
MFVPVSIPLQERRTRTFCVTGFSGNLNARTGNLDRMEFSGRTAIAAASPWSVRGRTTQVWRIYRSRFKSHTI